MSVSRERYPGVVEAGAGDGAPAPGRSKRSGGDSVTAPLPAVLREALETRSQQRIVHSEIDVKLWASRPPSCAAARPACCPGCAAASREPGRALVLVGHGLRARTVEGPMAPGEPPTATDLAVRRYRCRACGAIVVVVPRGVGRGYRYSLGAIGWALALWSYERMTAAATRARSSTAQHVGAASATRWASLLRWTRSALRLFGTAAGEHGTLRERAARIVTFVASHAPISAGPVAIDAFYGASFCQPRSVTSMAS